MTLMNCLTSNKYYYDKSESERIAESHKQRIKYPSHIPVIISCEDVEMQKNLRKYKMLIKDDCLVSYLSIAIRKNINENVLRPSEAIYLFIGKRMVSGNATMKDVYEEEMKHRGITKNDEGIKDVFLYVTISKENCFGV
jgi:hypothetical protein